MITKTYTCDRCKVTDTTNGIGLCRVTVTTSSAFSMPRAADWCKKCINEVGLCETMPEVERIKPPPTIEDIIREIVRKELPQ